MIYHTPCGHESHVTSSSWTHKDLPPDQPHGTGMGPMAQAAVERRGRGQTPCLCKRVIKLCVHAMFVWRGRMGMLF